MYTFDICIIDPSGTAQIGAITVKLDHDKLTSTEFQHLLTFLRTDPEQFVADINSCGLGTPSFNRVAQKVQDLKSALPNAIVEMDLNLAHYGVDIDYDDVGIAMPFEEPELVVNVYGEEHTRVYENDFHTVLFNCLVDAEG
jgi:hypothetical protein